MWKISKIFFKINFSQFR